MISTAVSTVQPVGGVNIINGSKKGLNNAENVSDFGMVMSQSLSEMNNNTTNTSVNHSKADGNNTEEKSTDVVSDTNAAESNVTDNVKKTEKDSLLKETQETPEEEIVEEIDISGNIVNAADILKKKIMDIFDVTEEDIENALQILGLNIYDLFNDADMTQFVAVINGNEDTLSILTDRVLSDGLSQLNEFTDAIINEIAQENNITAEETEVLIKEFSSISETADTEEVQVKMPEITLVDNRTEQTFSKGTDDKPMEQHTKDSESSFGEIVLNNLSNAVNESAGVETLKDVPQFTAASIVSQIIEAARVTLNNQVSSMELTLNPETLGKINLSVSVKEGVVTAQIAADNQVAKEAIESQVVLLREQLNNQGLKVDAVEVTIASHSFEAGYDQGNTNADNNDDSKKGKRAGIGNIDLSSLEDLDIDSLSEEERIVADMMASEGNLVNYKV